MNFLEIREDYEKRRSDLLKKYGFDEEEAEISLDVLMKTGFPRPYLRHRILYEAINAYVEESYFWILDHLKHDWAFTHFDKITDIFAASEQSAFFGVSEQRLGLQQDKAAQYLRGISEMLKALFQIVRELRIIDERISYYENTFERKTEDEAVGSEITLKGIWIDQVEGGVKNASSVYGLAQTVGFSILPDLFFRVRVGDSGLHKIEDYGAQEKKMNEVILEIDRKVEAITGFNEKVKEVLKRKLTQYYTWKLRTYRELTARKNFTLKYLRQHYDTIKLYTGWIKPYLRNIKRLQLDEGKIRSADLVSAFEGAMVEIEILCRKMRKASPFALKGTEGFSKYFPCMIIHFVYRTTPSMTYTAEGYQRGPAHTGKFDFTIRAYAWTEEEMENYRRMREEEDLELLGSIDDSIKAAMDSLGDELKAYLMLGGEEIYDQEKKWLTGKDIAELKKLSPAERIKKMRELRQARERKEQKEETVLDPFKNVLFGLRDMAALFVKLPSFTSPQKEDHVKIANEISGIQRWLRIAVYQTYKNYKKAHGFIQW